MRIRFSAVIPSQLPQLNRQIKAGLSLVERTQVQPIPEILPVPLRVITQSIMPANSIKYSHLRTHNPKVAGSNPAPATIKFNKTKTLEEAARCGLFLFYLGCPRTVRSPLRWNTKAERSTPESPVLTFGRHRSCAVRISIPTEKSRGSRRTEDGVNRRT